MAVSIVPTTRVRQLARRIVADAVDNGGHDAILRALPTIRDADVVPLLALLAGAAADNVGGPVVEEIAPLPGFTSEDRRLAHNAWARGIDTPLVRRGEQAYQRERKRAARAGRKAS